MRLLLVEDNAALATWLAKLLRGENYAVDVLEDAESALGGVDFAQYDVALIDLEEGVRMMSRVDGLAPEAVHIGMAVQARVQSSESGNLVVFVPAGGQA